MSISGNQVSAADVDQLTALFGLLSDKTRLRIILSLIEGERNVSWLCNELKLAQPTVSHHLGLLREQRIVGNRRDGKQVFYQLSNAAEAAARELSFHSPHWSVRVLPVNNEIHRA